MRKYNVSNYARYKKDVREANDNLDRKSIQDILLFSRDELIIYYLPFVEFIAKGFSTSQQASGIMSFDDLVQEGSIGLIMALDNIDWEFVTSSTDKEKTIKAFIHKRIRGAIRRAIDINRGNMRIPEYKINEIRREPGKDKDIMTTFFNQIFVSIDDNTDDNGNNVLYEIPDTSPAYNVDIMNKYILGIMRQHLTNREYEVLRLSCGLDCDKMPAKDIAIKLNIDGTSNYVRVSEIKRAAINKLIENVPANQIIDYLV